MSKSLKEEIAVLEAMMALENAKIEEQNELLSEESVPPVLVPALTVGIFVAGFIFARKKTLPALLKTSTALFLSGKKVYRNIRHFI